MKVGIYMDQDDPTAGGATTFRSELLHVLEKLAGESRHEFHVMTRCKEQQVSNGKFRRSTIHVPLHRKTFHRGYYSCKAILKKMMFPRSPYLVPSAYEKHIITTGVDLMWYIDPYCVTSEIPYFITVFDLEHRKHPFFPEVSAQARWETKEANLSTSIRKAARVITGTETGKAEIERFYQVPAERIAVIPYPSPVSYGEKHPGGDCGTCRLDGGPYKDFLLYPAQFWPHKNHANLLHALKQLEKTWGLKIPAVFVGSDKENNRAYIQRTAADLGLKDRIHFLGFIPRECLVCLYRSAFALVFPSFFGPDNLPPLEAFALGCPVLASNVVGVREQLGDAAILVEPTSPDSIADGIRMLHDRPSLRQELIQKGLTLSGQRSTSEYIRVVFSLLDEFEVYRRCWDSGGR